MNTFVNAVRTQDTFTTNGMKAKKNTGQNCVDLFFNIGSMRNANPIPNFVAALAENEDIALRILLWSRDVRGGAGERDTFRKILKHLEKTNPDVLKTILPKVPELGRWDDLLVFETKEIKAIAYTMIGDALRAGNGLCAKWMPREKSSKDQIAKEIREFFGMTPRQYRKSLTALTNVVEQQMCSGNWNEIEFGHVPSVASSRYKKAFYKHVPEQYADYVKKLSTGEAKIHAGAIFPHDVIKDLFGYIYDRQAVTDNVIKAQWEALPNYVGDSNILAMVDVSGSMSCSAGKGGPQCMQVAVSLGLYVADKNKGPFKDTFLTFSSNPELLHLKGNIVQKVEQMKSANWGTTTDIVEAFRKILDVAKKNNVRQLDMPQILMIMSDMQFDRCADYSGFEAMKAMYEQAGYDMPKIIFWNLNAAYGNFPVTFDTHGTAMVSGFSPTILKSILSGNMDDFTPEAIMLKTVMDDRYSIA